MKMNGRRLMDDLNYLRTLTDTPDEGVTRFSYGAMDRQARTWLKDIADAYGASWKSGLTEMLLSSTPHIKEQFL